MQIIGDKDKGIYHIFLFDSKANGLQSIKEKGLVDLSMY